MAKPVQTKDMPIPIPCLQLCPVFFSIFFFFYFLLLLQHQAWVWHSPPPPTHYAHPRAHAGSVPSSCDTELSHWGWAEPGITLLLSLVHLSACSSPHPEPTLCLPYTHKCPCWQSPLAEGAKGGQLCAKPVVVHPGLPLSSTKNPPALQSGWALHMVPLPRAPGCLCPCVHLYRSGQWMVPAGWVSHYCVLFCFSPCVEELLQEWKKVQETGGGGRREGHQKTNNADVPRVHRQKPKPGGCKETRERCENRTSVRDTSPCTLPLLSHSGHNGSQCARLSPLSYACQTAGKFHWIEPHNTPEMDISRDSCICFPCRQREALWFAHVRAGTTRETLTRSWALNAENRAPIRREHAS